MKDNFRDLRVKQLSRTLAVFKTVREEARPHRGWLQAIREGLGLSLDAVGKRLGQSRRRVQEFEKAEEENRITLHSLSGVADALGCTLIYAIVPKSGTLTQLAEQNARDDAKKRVLSVEHSMALENQGVGHVKELIDSETRRITTRRRP
jgi:predicted DNA-binding mobile mystery protein A